MARDVILLHYVLCVFLLVSIVLSRFCSSTRAPRRLVRHWEAAGRSRHCDLPGKHTCTRTHGLAGAPSQPTFAAASTGSTSDPCTHTGAHTHAVVACQFLNPPPSLYPTTTNPWKCCCLITALMETEDTRGNRRLYACMCLHVGVYVCLCMYVCVPLVEWRVSTLGLMTRRSASCSGCLWLQLHPGEWRSKIKSDKFQQCFLLQFIIWAKNQSSPKDEEYFLNCCNCHSERWSSLLCECFCLIDSWKLKQTGGLKFSVGYRCCCCENAVKVIRLLIRLKK